MLFCVVQNNVCARSWWSLRWIGTGSAGALLMCCGLFWRYLSLWPYVSTRFCHMYLENTNRVVSLWYFKTLSVMEKPKAWKETPGWLSLTSRKGMVDLEIPHRKTRTFKWSNAVETLINYSSKFLIWASLLGGSGTFMPSPLAGIVFFFSFIQKL